MVAVVTSAGLGLHNGSLAALGSQGQLGEAAFGRGSERVYVNATNGNLLLQHRDEFLAANGLPLDFLRTYNSQGQAGDAGNWRLGYSRRVYGLSGALNAAGSAIHRQAEDGSDTLYAYDAARSRYLSQRSDDGADDTLQGDAQGWTWTDGASQRQERYDTSGRLFQVKSRDGQTIEIGYDGAGRIVSLKDASGETLFVDYTAAGQLSQLRSVYQDGRTATRTRYGYDEQGRLASVTTDLTPADNSVADGQVYTTRYVYDGTSQRLASLQQSDGSRLDFSYVQVGADYRVRNVSDVRAGQTLTTTFDYDAAGNRTTVTDAAGQTTQLDYDNGQLRRVAGGGVEQRYNYDSHARVSDVSDGRGQTTHYDYDAAGNRIGVRDAQQQQTTRRYNAQNQLVSETVAGAGTTRYVYDAGGLRLRFAVSAEGRVVERRYDDQGREISRLTYPGASYTQAGDATGEAELATWAAQQDPRRIERLDTGYDLRGLVAQTTRYATLDAQGKGVADGRQQSTRYVYDPAGNLLQSVDAVSGKKLADYAYDGLNRVTRAEDGNKVATVTVYNDAQRQTQVTLSNGLTTVTSYDAAGHVIGVLQQDAGGPLGTALTQYNGQGLPVKLTDANGALTYLLYDGQGRKVGQIDNEGSVSEWRYNGNGQVTATIRYANRVDAAKLGADPAQLQLAQLRPAADPANDRIDYALYDSLGRLALSLNAEGGVTRQQYDAAGRLIASTRYATRLSAERLAALAQASGELNPDDAANQPAADPANDRVSRQFYDRDGKLIASLDGEGYLSETRYNGAGHAVETVRYANRAQGGATLDAIRPAASGADQHTRAYYDGAGRLIGQLDAEGYLDETVYDSQGRIAQTIRYANRANAGASLDALRPAADRNDRKTLRQYDDAGQLLRETTQPTGLVTSYQYDDQGHVLSVTRQAGGDSRSALKRYDRQGRLIQELSGEGAQALAALGNGASAQQIDAVWSRWGTRHYYNAGGQRTATLSPDGQGGAGRRTLYYYDGVGRLSHTLNSQGEIRELRYNAFGEAIDTRGYATRLSAEQLAQLNGGARNSLGAVVSSLQRDGVDNRHQTSYTRLGQRFNEVDATGLTTDRWDYNAFGERISHVQRLQGQPVVATQQQWRYDRAGRQLQQIDDAKGLALTRGVEYDAFGRQTATIDGNGHRSGQQYDKLGRQLVSQDGAHGEQSYAYDAFGRELSHRDALGHVTTTVYDDAAGTVTVTQPGGIQTVSQQNAYGETVQLIDALGHATTYQYNRAGQLLSATTPAGTTSSAYDSAGQVITTTDARGVKTVYQYDAAGRALSRTVDPDGLKLTTQTSYDAQGRVLRQSDPSGRVSENRYDANGRLQAVIVDPDGLKQTTTYDYDGQGKQIRVTEAASTPQAKVTEYEYDGAGRRVRETVDPNGLKLTTRYTYDGAGNVISKTDANGQVTRYVYDDGDRLRYTVDPLGYVTEQRYDAAGKVLEEKRYDASVSLSAQPSEAELQAALAPSRSLDLTGSSGNAGVVENGQLKLTGKPEAGGAWAGMSVPGLAAAGSTFQVELTPAQLQDTLHVMVQNTVGKTGRLCVLFRADGTAYAQVADAKDQWREVLLGAYQAGTTYELEFATNATGGTLYLYAKGSSRAQGLSYTVSGEYEWSQLQLQFATCRAPALTRETTAYVSRASVSGPAAHSTRYVYDAAGRLQSTSQGDGITQAQTVRYELDGFGHRVKEWDGRGNVTTREFDALGRVRKETHGEGDATVTDYDAFGNAVKITDPRGNAGYFYFDALGRRILQVDPEGSVTRTDYDAFGNAHIVTRYANAVDPAQAAVGVLPTVSADAKRDAVTTIEHDALGRQTRITDAEGGVEQMAYDAFGNKVQYTNQLGGVFRYDYDGAGHVLKETGPADNDGIVSVKRFEYDAFGNRTLQVEAEGRPEQRTTRYGYDANNRLVKQSGDAVTIYTVGQGVQNNVTPTETRRYDAAGNLVEFIDANGNVTRTAYDSQNRKVRERNGDGYVTTWAYDGNGNVIEQRVYATAVGLPADGSAPQPADGTCRVTRFEYDKNNRLRGTIVPNQIVGMRDAVDGKYKIQAQDLATGKQYDANGNAVRETDARGNRVYRYYDRAGRKVLEVDAAGYAVAWDYNSVGKPIRETRYAVNLGVPADGDTLDMVKARLKTDAQDRISEFDYDRMGRVVEERRRNVQLSKDDGVSETLDTVRTQYHYNALGLVDRQTDAKGGVTDILYDALGRETHREEAVFVSYQEQAVRPTTDSHYNGLGQLARSVKAGVAVDFSKLNYGVGGRLLSRVDAEQNITYYEYDAAGNVTRTQHPRQQAAGQPLLQDLVSYQYNAAKQQIARQDASSGLWTETRYNAWGQITGKGTSLDRSGVWQEFSEYDGAGRLVKGNAGGATKLYGYDANGNATLAVESGAVGGDELHGMSLDQVMALVEKRIDHQTPMDNLRLTVTDYDVRNKQIATYQPLMINARQQSSVQVERWISVKPQPNNGAIVTMGPVGKQLPPDTNPLLAGVVTCIGTEPQGWPFTGVVKTYGIVGLPDNADKVILFYRGWGNLTIKYSDSWAMSSQNFPIQSSNGKYVPLGSMNGFFAVPGVEEFYYVVLDASGNSIASSRGVLRRGQNEVKQFDQISRGGSSPYSFYKYDIGTPRIPNFGSGTKGVPPGPDTVYFGFGEPTSGARIRFRTSNGAWGEYQNVAMSEMGGVYKFSLDKITLPIGGEYQYQIDSLNSSGSVQNTYIGEFSPGGRIFTQPCLLRNAIQQLHFLESTGQAVKGVIRYRLKGADNYTTSSLLRDERGGFYWNAAGELLLPMGDSAHYEYQYELLSDQGLSVSRGSGEVALSIPVSSVPLPRDPRAEGVDFSYRKLGDNGPFIKGLATNAWLGPVDTTFQDGVVSKYEYKYEAFTDNVDLTKYPFVTTRTSYGTYSGIATFGGENRIIRNDSLPLPLGVTFSTDRKDASQLNLLYRVKGSNAEWQQTSLPRSAQGGFLFNVDSLAVGDYEYRYQLRDSDGNVLRDKDGVVINVSGYLHRGSGQEETSVDNLQWVLLGVSDSEASVIRRQHFNAFGEVDSETDGEQNTTRYAYSTTGKLLSKQDPQTSITLENGQKQTVSPLTQYRYDAMGNSVATIDANGHVNRQGWVSGSRDGQGKIWAEWHADGSYKSMSYDQLGNLRVTTANSQHRQDYTYDNLGRLKRVDRAAGANGQRGYDEYDYDSAGQRIAHRTTSDGRDLLTDTTRYDSLGRVLETVSAAQRHTRYSYQWDSMLLGAGGTVVGGWRTTTTNANNQTQQDAVNLFGLKGLCCTNPPATAW